MGLHDEASVFTAQHPLAGLAVLSWELGAGSGTSEGMLEPAGVFSLSLAASHHRQPLDHNGACFVSAS